MRAPLSNHGHFLSTVEDCRPLYLPVIDLAPRGESGMDAFAEEADSSSSSSASSDRPSTVLPIVALPEDSSHGSHERKNIFQDFLIMSMNIVS